jgi:hypothetical protein
MAVRIKHLCGTWHAYLSANPHILGAGVWRSNDATTALEFHDEVAAKQFLIAHGYDLEPMKVVFERVDGDVPDMAASALLALALRYLEHPDVQAIPFALPAAAVAERIRTALARAKAAALVNVSPSRTGEYT